MHAEHILSHMHSNVCRPLPTLSHYGYYYFITFIDNASCFASITPLQQKLEVGKALKTFIT
jgi:hypothetical protein